MLRRVSYRSAATAFVFAGLWFVLGLVVLVSPIASALGIWRELFFAWTVVFLIVLAVAGGSLTIAAYNGLFPPAEQPMRPPPGAAPAHRTSVAASPPATSPGFDADGRPLPWTGPALPERAPRRPRPQTRPQRPADDRRAP
jgi:hypothetical protein